MSTSARASECCSELCILKGPSCALQGRAIQAGPQALPPATAAAAALWESVVCGAFD